MSQFVRINEVGPRDGLQNEPQTIPTDIKIAFIDALSETGLTNIETTSFVSPQWIPQLADHQAVFSNIKKKKGIHYPVLIPNLQGLNNAIECGVTDIAVFTAASEDFTKKNTNCSIDESLIRIAEITTMAKQHQLTVRGYISCVIACPYAGKTDPLCVTEIAQRLMELGCEEVSLGDTIGVGTPKDFTRLLDLLLQDIAIQKVALHCHDTYQHALDNIQRGLEIGIRSMDSSVGGLGGCPYAKGASGNVATEKVVQRCHQLGFETGVDLKALQKAFAIVEPFITKSKP